MRIHRRAALAAAAGIATIFRATRARTAEPVEWPPRLEAWLDATLAGSWLDRWTAPWLDRYVERLADTPWLRAVDAFATSRDGLIVLAVLALGLVIAAFFARRLRPTADLAVRIRFPDAIDAELVVALHRRSQRRKGGARDATRWSRKGVERETQFERVPTGRFFVTIDGRLRARRSGAILAEVAEELETTLVPRQQGAVACTLPDVESPIELRIVWDRKPTREAALALAGQPRTLRYAQQGVVRMTLPIGDHRIVVGGGDRVVERALRITDYEPSIVRIDLAEPEGLVFKGCPPAVQPFLQGDVANAAQALERDGHPDRAALLLARFHQEQGRTAHAAVQLEQAGRLREAAELHASLGDAARAAPLFERAGALRPAAEAFERAGVWADAARLFAAVEAWPEAARCFEQAGDARGLRRALEAQGEWLRAAALASEQDDRAEAIRLLQQIRQRDPDFGRACELLAFAYEQEGHLDLAARQIELRLEALGPGEQAPELELQWAELLEASDEPARALEVLGRLRDRDPTYPNVASRMESIRKKLSGTGSETAPLFTPPPGATAFVKAERYELLEEVGRGGMGLVYKARDRRLGRIVALKRMPENLSARPEAVQLFLGEAQAAARMNHPNIVTLYDADQENGRFFITMELLEGLPLNTILRERGRFGPRDTARLGVQVCAGLQYAHEQGIVHRDIKTSNLFITRDRVLKIMDFGLAKILEAVREDGATIIAGTPFYMAPEQAAGRVTDGRTDLYALGVTLFELSTGRLPFREGDVAAQHREAKVPDPSLGIDDYPPALAQLIQRLMAKRLEDRPASAAGVAELLRAIIAAG